jgi:hemerythrin HHE cation binding domain-containing protein
MILKAPARQVPRALQCEHEELRDQLTRLANEPGQIGEAATEVAAIFEHHAVREEEFALPPLGLLASVAAGVVTNDPGAVAMARQLRSELPRMLDEHLAIVAALQILQDKANELDRPDASAFARKLILHAELEEEVLYPAAILLGKYLEERDA